MIIKTIKDSAISSIQARIARGLNTYIKPRFINFVTSYRCDSRCLTCNIWGKYLQDGASPKDELTLSDIEDFFSDNKEQFSDIVSIGLTGGEPTLRSDIAEIARFFHDTFPGAALGFQTNGLNPERVRSALKSILKFDPNFNIAVSIDGPKDMHDKIRGISGAFDKAMLTIRYAKEAGVSRITSGMTINRENFAYIPDVYRICKEAGTEFSCFLTETSGYFNNEGVDYGLDKEQIKTVIESLRAFKNDYYMDNLRLQLEKKRKIDLPCYSGYTSLVIDPYGNIKPCILMDRPFGNIKKDKDFKKMMTMYETRRIRKGLKSCRCWCQCEASPSAFVDPVDVAWWLVFYCKDRRGFLRKIMQRWG